MVQRFAISHPPLVMFPYLDEEEFRIIHVDHSSSVGFALRGDAGGCQIFQQAPRCARNRELDLVQSLNAYTYS